MYHRLLAFKQLAAKLASERNQSRLNPLSVELGLSAPVPNIDVEGNAAEHYYEHLLDLAEKLFDGEIDASTFEEQLRYMVGIRAYPLFTIDKLIGTAIKHVRHSRLNRFPDVLLIPLRTDPHDQLGRAVSRYLHAVGEGPRPRDDDTSSADRVPHGGRADSAPG